MSSSKASTTGKSEAPSSGRKKSTVLAGSANVERGEHSSTPVPNSALKRRSLSESKRKGTESGDGSGGPMHGRRGNRRDNDSKFDGDKAANFNRVVDTELNHNVPTVYDGIAELDQVRREQEGRDMVLKEHFAKHISDPPTGYHAPLPRLSELHVTNSWDKLLRMMRSEHDTSCLTSCLARELDEDVVWNPDMLLVQLTSDMLDAAELQDGAEAYVPVDARDIGQMTGGEVTRRRREKDAAATGAGASKAELSGGAAAPAPGGKGAVKEAFKKTNAAASANAAPPTSASQAGTSKAQRKQSTASMSHTSNSEKNVNKKAPPSGGASPSDPAASNSSGHHK